MPEQDAVGNVIAWLDGHGEPMLLSAHLDCVVLACASVSWTTTCHRRSTILGADDRAGMAAILEAVASLREDTVAHPPLEIVFTVQEELGHAGAKALDLTRLRARDGLVLDSHGPVGGAILSAPSYNAITVTIVGRAAHSGMEPEKGCSAIQVAACNCSHALGARDSETTANIGTMQGHGA